MLRSLLRTKCEYSAGRVRHRVFPGSLVPRESSTDNLAEVSWESTPREEPAGSSSRLQRSPRAARRVHTAAPPPPPRPALCNFQPGSALGAEAQRCTCNGRRVCGALREAKLSAEAEDRRVRAGF